MSNKLVKKPAKNADAGNKDSAMKTFFSVNGIGQKVYSIYEDRKKLQSVRKRKSVNNIISTVIMMVLLIALTYTTKNLAVFVSSLLFATYNIAIAVWRIHNQENKKVQIVCIVFNVALAALLIVAFYTS